MARRSRRRRKSTEIEAASAAPPGLLVPSLAATGYAGAGNGYDGVGASTMRGYIYWPQLDTRREITPQTRIEIMRRARALTENIGLATHIVEGLADLIGYLTPMAATTDREWNELATASFRDRQSIPEVFDASGKFSFWEYQLQLDIAAFRDGDILPVLTETSGGTARLATFEAHQIANPYDVPANSQEWRDGVKVNRFLRHQAYHLVDPEDRTRVRVVRAEDALYYGHFKKIGHTRPVSILRHAINHLIDLSEIVRDVKYGIKVRNQIPLTLETAAGSPGFGQGATSALVDHVRKTTVPVKNSDGTVTEQEIEYEAIMNGGNIPRLQPGQSLKAIIDSAPHPNQLQLLEFLVRDISWGCGVAPEILWDINSLRGANNRLLNAKLQRWIGARLLRKRNFVRRFYVYAIAKEMKAGRLRECRDPEWWKVAMLPQANITADRGREGKLDIELVANRLMSLEEFFAKDGKYWLGEIRQMAEENRQLGELGLAVADVARRALKAAPEEATEPDDDDPAADPGEQGE